MAAWPPQPTTGGRGQTLSFTVLHCFQANCHFTMHTTEMCSHRHSTNSRSSYSLWIYKTCAFSEFPSSPQKRLCEAEIFFFFRFLKQKETDSKIFYFPSVSYRLSYTAQQKTVRIKILINIAFDVCEIFRSTHTQKIVSSVLSFRTPPSGLTAQCWPQTAGSGWCTAPRIFCPRQSSPSRPPPAAAAPRPAPNLPRRPWAPPQRTACASCTCAELPSAEPPIPGQHGCPGRRGGTAAVAECHPPASAPRPEPSGPRPTLPDPPSRPHLLLALAAEAQARGPLFVAVAVVGAGLVRLELHHPPGPGGEPCGGLGVGRERGRGKAAADGRARAPPARRRRGGGSGCRLHGSAAGQPHCPRTRPRAALTAAVATATAPSIAAAPDDDRAAILGARRQLRQERGPAGAGARAQRRRRSGIAPVPRARHRVASALRAVGAGEAATPGA